MDKKKEAMTKKEKLIEQFATYEGSRYFIECSAEAFSKSGWNDKQLVWFVNNHFKCYTDCDIVMMRKCAAHWNNVQWTKLYDYDFINYRHSLHTLSQYRMVIKIMEL